MNKYKNFLVEDFLHDQFFCEWAQNKCAEEDANLWEKWIEDNPEMIDIVEESKNIFLAFNDQPATVAEGFYINLKNRIDETITAGKKKNFFVTHWVKLAAVFVGLMVTASFLFYSSSGKNEFVSFSSKYAETRKIVLPDGSVVMLNAKSFIQYKNSFGKKREVWVRGEAFFIIKHIEGKDQEPVAFVVHANDLNVEVMGTQFNVNTFKQNETKVLLTKGKVRLSLSERDAEPLTMSPGDFVSFNNTTNRLIKSKVNSENYIAWLSHKYIFEKTTLEDLSTELQHYYGKEFTIKDPKMRKQELSGTLELQDKDALIKTLSVLLKVPVREVNNKIIIGS